jgi:hypothetical protein
MFINLLIDCGWRCKKGRIDVKKGDKTVKKGDKTVKKGE